MNVLYHIDWVIHQNSKKSQPVDLEEPDYLFTHSLQSHTHYDTREHASKEEAPYIHRLDLEERYRRLYNSPYTHLDFSNYKKYELKKSETSMINETVQTDIVNRRLLEFSNKIDRQFKYNLNKEIDPIFAIKHFYNQYQYQYQYKYDNQIEKDKNEKNKNLNSTLQNNNNNNLKSTTINEEESLLNMTNNSLSYSDVNTSNLNNLNKIIIDSNSNNNNNTSNTKTKMVPFPSSNPHPHPHPHKNKNNENLNLYVQEKETANNESVDKYNINQIQSYSQYCDSNQKQKESLKLQINVKSNINIMRLEKNQKNEKNEIKLEKVDTSNYIHFKVRVSQKSSKHVKVYGFMCNFLEIPIDCSNYDQVNSYFKNKQVLSNDLKRKRNQIEF